MSMYHFFGALGPYPDYGDNFEEVETFVNQCLDELKAKTQSFKRDHQFDKDHSWFLTQDDGLLLFKFSDGRTLKAPVQIVGTFYTVDSTWLWSWANSSTEPALTTAAREVLEYGKRHQIPCLTERKWEATEDDGWLMTAIASHLHECKGAYRGYYDDLMTFMLFGDFLKD